MDDEQQALAADADTAHEAPSAIVVRSVFRQTVDNGTELDEVADHFTGRLDALARTQVIVTRTADGQVDLENLIRDELLIAEQQRSKEPLLLIKG